MNDDSEEVVADLRAHGECVAGTLKIVRATPPEELTRALVGELKGLLEDSFATVAVAMDRLAGLVSGRPRQTRIDDFTAAVPAPFYREADENGR
jgi:hypothetical protein